MNRIVSAIFDSHSEAERAVSELLAASMSDRSLSLIVHPGGQSATASDAGEASREEYLHVLRGLLGGGALGAGLGVAALAIPGVGALGAITATSAPGAAGIGAAVGALAGSIRELLKDHGVGAEDASYHDEQSGGVIISVDSADVRDAEVVREILYESGGRSPEHLR